MTTRATADRGRTQEPGWFLRTCRLLRAFRMEQRDPGPFNRLVALEGLRRVRRFVGDLSGITLLDIGGGPSNDFGDAFRSVGCHYLVVDRAAATHQSPDDMAGIRVAGCGMELPIKADSVDVVYCNNVLEHVPDPCRMVREIVRVTKPGGTIVLSYTLWFSPWGGHETSPWHYLGGARAALRYERRQGRPPKNRYGHTMYRRSATEVLRCVAAEPGAHLVAVLPTYHPRWLEWVARVPVVRELAALNLTVVLRVRR